MTNIMRSGSVSSWAWAYDLNFRQRNMMSIVMPVNLTSNIGYGEDATHTKKTQNDPVKVGTLPESILLYDDLPADYEFTKKFLLKKNGSSKLKLGIYLVKNSSVLIILFYKYLKSVYKLMRKKQVVHNE